MARREGPYADYRGQVAEAAAELPPGERRKDTLAIDCFHPSVRGQELLSQSLWQAVEDLP
jgi:lysophospholipase L1-like esterase